MRGTLDRARDATARTATGRVAENLDLFRRMRAGEFPNGARVLRAKIDMAAGNINLRDPVLYRILHATHPRTGTPLVHLPDLRFRARPVGCDRGRHAFAVHPRIRGSSPALRLADRQFAGARRGRGNTSSPASISTIRCCRSAFLTELVRQGKVSGWDDPRMPTLAGAAAPRRAAGGGPRFCSPRRRRAGEQHRRCRDVRARGARAPQQDRAAPDGGAAAVEDGDRELPRGRSRGAGGGEQPRGPRRRDAAHPVRARALCRARRLHGAAAKGVLPARRRGAR